MAEEENIQHPAYSIKRKRSGNWDLEETNKLVNKCGEVNIQERLKSCTLFV